MTTNQDFIDRLALLAGTKRNEGGDKGAPIDRAALALLRRGLSTEPRDLARVYPYVLPFVADERQEDAYIQLACLFGLHPTAKDDLPSALSLGRALRLYMNRSASDSVEARFVALLRCHRDELPDHLRHAVTLVRSESIPLRWVDILFALQRWSSDDTSISSAQRNWSRDFWAFDGDRDEKLTSTDSLENAGATS